MIMRIYIALTMDNASVNDVIARSVGTFLMQNLGIHFTPESSQIHCVAHVVNLVVQSDEADDPENVDYFNKDLPVHYDPTDDAVQQEMENEKVGEDEMLDTDDDDGEGYDESMSALKKVRDADFLSVLANMIFLTATCFLQQNC
jgi:hypothetical protein